MDEAHTFLGHAPCHEALSAEAPGVAVVETIQVTNVLRLLVEIEHLRHAGLHLVGEFVALDDAFDFWIAGITFEEFAIGLLDELDLLSLLRIAEPAMAQIRHATTGRAEACALKSGGQKGAAVVHRTAGIGHGIDGDKSGQILRLGAEPIDNPCAHRWPHKGFTADMQRHRGHLMGIGACLHAIEQAEIVRVF